MNEQIFLNGFQVRVYIREWNDGLRVRLWQDDWERCQIHRGQRILVRRHGYPEEQLFLAEAVEMPPVTWLVLENSMRMVVSSESG